MATALDVLTLNEAKDILSIDHADIVTARDLVIASYITATSTMLDRLCGPVVTRVITGEVQDGGGFACFLDHYPVLSITSVVEYLNTTATTLTAESNTVKTASNYAADLTIGTLWRRVSNRNSVFAPGTRNIVITYAAGRYADTASVEQRFKLAAQVILANLWRREQGSGTITFGAALERTIGATFALPNAAKQLIVDDFKAPRVM